MQVDKDQFAAQFNVSRETLALLEQYETLLEKWNPKINLVSKATLSDIWHRHFADSAQLWDLIPEKQKSWLDFGSGAGFPALVIAVLAKEKQPDLEVHLVESDHRKCAFLLTVIRALALKATVSSVRIEALPPKEVDIISARALAPLESLLEMSFPHAHKSTVLLFPKGNNYETELTAAQKHWHIDVETVPSITDSGSVILRIKDFRRVS